MRRLATDLVQQTGLTLGNFDVLVQLSAAGGELRMTELAARVFSSRSGLTRRIDSLVEEGLVHRSSAEADARGVVVTLTKTGMARLAEIAPVHLRGVVEPSWRRLTTRSSRCSSEPSGRSRATARLGDMSPQVRAGPVFAMPIVSV